MYMYFLFGPATQVICWASQLFINMHQKANYTYNAVRMKTIFGYPLFDFWISTIRILDTQYSVLFMDIQISNCGYIYKKKKSE